MPKSNVKNLILIIILAFVLFTSNIGGLYIYALDEAKNSVCAREMMERGDLIVPTFNYELRTDKPPLHYYFMQLSYLIFGFNEFAARFFSAIMGVLTVIVTWWLSNRYFGQRVAMYSSIALLASLHFILQFHMAVPDPYLIFLLTAGFAAFYVFYKEDNKRYLLISYLCFGLGSLTKGPVAIALPGLAILLFIIIKKDLSLSYIMKLKPLWILGILVLVVMPWYVMVGIKTDGEWLREFFFYHNLNRYTNTMEGHGAIFLVTPLMVMVGMLPLSIFLIQGIVKGWKLRKENDLLLYAILIIFTITTFFSISSTKLPNYTVPVYPFAAILIGFYLGGLQDRKIRSKSSFYIADLIYLLIMASIPVGLYIGLSQDNTLAHLNHLAWYFLVLPAGTIISFGFLLFNQFKGTILSIVTSWVIITLLFFYLIFPQIDKENPVAKTLNLIDKSQPVTAYRIYNPAFSFYIRKPFKELDNKDEFETYIKTAPEGYLITRKSFADEIDDNKRLRKIAEAKDIFEIPTTVIFKID